MRIPSFSQDRLQSHFRDNLNLFLMSDKVLQGELLCLKIAGIGTCPVIGMTKAKSKVV